MRYEVLTNGTLLPQGEGVFPLGTDALALADFARPPRGAEVCDLCAGAGALSLLLLDRDPSLRITALELQEAPCRALEQAAADNHLEGKLRVLRGDLRRIRALLPAGSFRQLVCNPPYYPPDSGFRPENEAQAIARMELCCTLEEVCAAAAWLLPTGGCLWMVHRPERLTELFSCLREKGLEPKLLRLVCPGPQRPPSLVLVKALRGARPGLRWEWSGTEARQ